MAQPGRDNLGRVRLDGRRLCREVAGRLADEYPGKPRELCALRHGSSFQLLVATILSAQCTDERVNEVTPQVFARFPGPEDLAMASTEELEDLIRSTGFYRSKARSLIGMAARLVDSFEGEVPAAIEDLVTLPGVGRKTANVVRSVELDLPGLPVDTHVARITNRLGLTSETDPGRIESEISPMLDPSELGPFSLRLILHGRRTCKARIPRCSDCRLADICPSAGETSPSRRSTSRRGAGQ